MRLSMGFTGKEPLRWRLAFVAAFNPMEAELQKPAYFPARVQLAHSLAAQAAAQVTQTVFGRHRLRPRLAPRVLPAQLRLRPRQPAHHSPDAGAGGRPDGHLPERAHPAHHQVLRHPPPTHSWPRWSPPAPSNSPNAPRCANCAPPPRASAAPATASTAVAAPVSPRIGHDGKPLPLDTFRAVFV